MPPDVAVLRIEQTGGMLPPWETLGWYPSVALYADGRLIMQGAQDDIYPGRALPNVVVTQLTERGVAQVLQWAAEAGLAGEDRMLGEPMLDSGVTTFVVTTPTGTHTTSVTDMSAADPEVGALRELIDVASNPRIWLADDIASEETPYVAGRLRFIAFPAEPDSLPDRTLVTVVDWPLDPISTLGTSYGEPAEYRCATIEGDDLATMLPLFQQANELTLWRSEDVTYQLYAHPLLPDDEPCPGF